LAGAKELADKTPLKHLLPCSANACGARHQLMGDKNQNQDQDQDQTNKPESAAVWF